MSETVTLVTCRDAGQAKRIARVLVGARLAACVNVLPGVTSVYTWKGRTETAREVLLLIKSTKARAKALAARVKKEHSYEVPEIVTLELDGGDAVYLRWLRKAVR